MFRLPSSKGCRALFAKDGYVSVAQSLDADDAMNAAAEASRMVRSFARSIDRRGEGSRLTYRVVTGDRIKSEAPILFDLYSSTALLEWVQQVTDCAAVSQSPHLRSAVNINCMTAPNEEYPEHQDAVPYTALLFLSDVAPDAGGPFVVHALTGEVVTIQPALGQLVLMDGSRCAHGVLPLVREAWRLTMPMVFPRAVVERPAGLDDYLYR
jgi:hypothetical protein